MLGPESEKTMSYRWVWFLCYLVCLTSGCGGDNGQIASLSGRAIHEVIGGAVGLPPRDSPLPDALISFHAVGSTTEVARVQTDSTGSFTLTLPVGTYQADLVDRTHQPLYDVVDPQQIEVSVGQTSQRELKFVQHVP